MMLLFHRNIRSDRSSYQAFQTGKTFSSPAWWRGTRKHHIWRGTLFISSTPNSVKYDRIKRLIASAAKAGMKVYLSDEWKGALKEQPGVTLLKKNSEKYVRALDRASYVYADGPLHHYYVKQKPQVLIADLPSEDRTTLDQRIVMDSLYNRADWILSQEPDGGERVLQQLVSGQLKGRPRQTGKINLLFLINMRFQEQVFGYFYHIVQRLDYEKYDVTLFLSDAHKAAESRRLTELDPRIHVIVKKGRTLCDGETARKLAFLTQENNYLPAMRRVERFLPHGLYAREVKRFFGDYSFDYVFNMKFDAVEWRLLLRQLPGKKVIYDLNDYMELGSQELPNKVRDLDIYDEILFANRALRDAALAYAPKVFGMRAVVAPAIADAAAAETPELVELDGVSYVLADCGLKPQSMVNALTLLPLPGLGCPFVQLSPLLTAEEACGLLRQALEKYPELTVFDPACVLTQRDLVPLRQLGTVWHHTHYRAYAALRALLGEELICSPAANVPESSILREILK